MTETEWRSIGVQQSRGWIHYMIHKPEPHILLFRRPKTEEQSIQCNSSHAHINTYTNISTHPPTSTCMHTYIHISVQIQLIYGAAALASAQLVVAAATYSQNSHAHLYTNKHTHTHLPPLCYTCIVSQQHQPCPYASVFFFNYLHGFILHIQLVILNTFIMLP